MDHNQHHIWIKRSTSPKHGRMHEGSKVQKKKYLHKMDEDLPAMMEGKLHKELY